MWYQTGKFDHHTGLILPVCSNVMKIPWMLDQRLGTFARVTPENRLQAKTFYTVHWYLVEILANSFHLQIQRNDHIHGLPKKWTEKNSNWNFVMKSYLVWPLHMNVKDLAVWPFPHPQNFVCNVDNLFNSFSVINNKLPNNLPKCLKHIGKAASEQSFLNRFTGFASSVPSIRLVDIETQLAPLPVKESRKERFEIQKKVHSS